MTTQVIYNSFGIPHEVSETTDQPQQPELKPIGNFYETLLNKTGDDWSAVEKLTGKPNE